jgi:glycosyltransferase involved in cell wall biosynthesis
MKLAIVDKIGLCYDGDTLSKQGLGGSESAVILIAKELSKIGFDVTVFNNCDDSSHSKPGIYDNVRYIDNKHASSHKEQYDVVVVSRTVVPFISDEYPFVHTATKRTLWLHDTFIEGDQIMEDLVLSGKIHHVFTLSDWHTSYILTAAHGKKRNHEVLKKSIFQTRNGTVCHIPEVDLSKKDRNHFVYNSSATKGMIPLIEQIWPKIKERLPEAHLTIIGGYYRFREGAAPDAQENTVEQLSKRKDLKDLDVTFTGVIPQHKIAEILSNASMMLYPGAFPETFGISALESLLYKTPLVTTRFGALEETAVEQACYLIDYAIEPNSLFPHIDKETQVQKFLDTFFAAYANPYLHQQKQNYCNIVKDIVGWDSVALQWKQFFYKISGAFLSVDEYKTVTRINDKVSRVFGRTSIMPALKEYRSFGTEQRVVVVSAFRNAENYIKNNILSVAQQNYSNYMHILINDASDDNSVNIAKATIEELPREIQTNFKLIDNARNKGAIQNQLMAIDKFCNPDDIVILLDGDDWLINNNTIFQYYNDLYSQGYEFTYGSMWSVVDNIPLIAQEYPEDVKQSKSYRDHRFNWKIPYTHLRTCLGKYFSTLDYNKFMVDNKWMKSGHDNPLFYGLIEQIAPDKIYCNQEIVCNYNDANPLNDYKVRGAEQNQNANLSYKKDQIKVKKILIAVPTAKYIEPETFKSIYDLDIPEGYKVEFQFFYGYQIDQIRNLSAEWAKSYDYMLSVDSDIILPKDTLTKMLSADKDIITGLYIQRIPNTHTVEVYMVTANGGMTNIPYELLKNKGIVEVAGCGFGACLVKSEVFRKMEYPHFNYQSALNHRDTISEDVYFCKKARDNGFKVWADTTIICDHKGTHYYKLNQDVQVLDQPTNNTQQPEIAVLDTNTQKVFK